MSFDAIPTPDELAVKYYRSNDKRGAFAGLKDEQLLAYAKAKDPQFQQLYSGLVDKVFNKAKENPIMVPNLAARFVTNELDKSIKAIPGYDEANNPVSNLAKAANKNIKLSEDMLNNVPDSDQLSGFRHAMAGILGMSELPETPGSLIAGAATAKGLGGVASGVNTAAGLAGDAYAGLRGMGEVGGGFGGGEPPATNGGPQGPLVAKIKPEILTSLTKYAPGPMSSPIEQFATENGFLAPEHLGPISQGIVQDMSDGAHAQMNNAYAHTEALTGEGTDANTAPVAQLELAKTLKGVMKEQSYLPELMQNPVIKKLVKSLLPDTKSFEVGQAGQGDGAGLSNAESWKAFNRGSSTEAAIPVTEGKDWGSTVGDWHELDDENLNRGDSTVPNINASIKWLNNLRRTTSNPALARVAGLLAESHYADLGGSDVPPEVQDAITNQRNLANHFYNTYRDPSVLKFLEASPERAHRTAMLSGDDLSAVLKAGGPQARFAIAQAHGYDLATKMANSPKAPIDILNADLANSKLGPILKDLHGEAGLDKIRALADKLQEYRNAKENAAETNAESEKAATELASAPNKATMGQIIARGAAHGALVGIPTTVGGVLGGIPGMAVGGGVAAGLESMGLVNKLVPPNPAIELPPRGTP